MPIQWSKTKQNKITQATSIGYKQVTKSLKNDCVDQDVNPVNWGACQLGTRSQTVEQLGFASAVALHIRAKEEEPRILLGWALLCCPDTDTVSDTMFSNKKTVTRRIIF